MNAPTPINYPNNNNNMAPPRPRPVPLRRWMSTPAVGASVVVVDAHDNHNASYYYYPKTTQQLNNKSSLMILCPPRKPLPHQLPPKKRYVLLHGIQGVLGTTSPVSLESTASSTTTMDTTTTAAAPVIVDAADPKTAQSLPPPKPHCPQQQQQQQAPSKKNSTEKQLGALMVAKQGGSVPSSVLIIPNSNSSNSNSNNSNNTVDDDRNNLAPIGMVIGDGRLGGRTSRKQQRKQKRKQQDTNCNQKRKRRKKKQNTYRDEQQLPASTFQKSNDSSLSGTTLSIKVNNKAPPNVAPPDYCFIQMLEEADKPESSDDFWFRVSFESFGVTNDCAELLNSHQILGFVSAMAEHYSTYRFRLRLCGSWSGDWEDDEPIPADHILNTLKFVLEFTDKNGFAASLKKDNKVYDRYPKT